VVVSGKEIVRPSGQIKFPHEERPLFSATRKLDFELETAFIVGKTTELGEPIAIEDAWDHIFGMVLLNDWSARDIQQWEYVPLGPFNAKTFASAISPWVVTMQALEPFKVKGPQQLPQPLDYLRENSINSFDIHLSVELQTAQSQHTEVICQTNFKYMYWSMAQQLTHHTISGCNVQVGDLMGSGTISGPTENSYGSLLELTWNTTKPLTLSNGEKRGFLEDGDSIVMKGYAEKGAIRVGFGQVANTILPAKQFSFKQHKELCDETV
jgi:fumarylacetoacetase